MSLSQARMYFSSEDWSGKSFRWPDPDRRSVPVAQSVPRLFYLVTIRLVGALGVCSAGEITNVTQVFQPSARFWLANSL
jgi:hypothetical protein